jgi:hypothetical protein
VVLLFGNLNAPCISAAFAQKNRGAWLGFFCADGLLHVQALQVNLNVAISADAVDTAKN